VSIREQIEAKLKKEHVPQAAIDAALVLCDDLAKSEVFKGQEVRVEPGPVYTRVHVGDMEVAIDLEGHFYLQFVLPEAGVMMAILEWWEGHSDEWKEGAGE